MDISAHQLLTPALPKLQAAERLLVAFSGGLDSTVLLHALARLFPPERLAAVHVDHGLSPASGHWHDHCQQSCHRLGIPLYSHQLFLNPGHSGIEQAARQGRYGFFAELLRAKELLLMAHHQDDQLETLLFRLLRGSGPRGLAGMPASRPLGAGELFRPLLQVPKSTLVDCAQAWQLTWIDDESNASLAFDRNFLRHQVLPVIAQRWPDYRQRLERTRTQCRAADNILGERAAEDLQQLGARRERLGHSLCLAGFARLSSPRQQNLLREWARGQGLGLLAHWVPAAVAAQLVAAKADASPRVGWSGGEFRRYRGRVYLLPLRPLPPSAPSQVLREPGDTPLPDGGRLCWRWGAGGALAVPAGAELVVRFRQGGERCRPLGRYGSAPLKKLLQEYHLEPWLRDQVPLVYVNGTLAAVGDLFVCRDFAAPAGEPGWRLIWDYPAPDAPVAA